MPKKKPDGRRGEPQARELPPGVKLVRTLKGHDGPIFSVAFDSAGGVLASGSGDGTIKLWETSSGKLLHTLEKHNDRVISIAFNPADGTLASGSADNTVKLWKASSGKLLHTLEGHEGWVISVAFDPVGRILASGSVDRTIKLWEASSGELLRTLEKHNDRVMAVAFNPAGSTLASGSADRTIKLWEASSGKLLRTLEGHTEYVYAIASSADGRLMATKSHDGSVYFWNCETWEPIARIREQTNPSLWLAGIAFHPGLPLIAMAGSDPHAPKEKCDTLIHILKLNLRILLNKTRRAKAASEMVHHTTTKIVLVGNSGVGKTGLGWRLAYGKFKEHSSTHGQQFWVLDQLSVQRADCIHCEAILWDLAGQPDYRLTHALFLDNVDLALVLFDPTDSRDPLHGVEFWLKQLKAVSRKLGDAQSCCTTILIGARADLGEARLTKDELDAFCRQRGISSYLATSAKEGIGLDELMQRIKDQISWGHKVPTVTTVTFKRIKDYVLGLKENRRRRKVIVRPEDLRKQLEKNDKTWKFTDAEMMTAVGHLENYGYVRVLRTSKGEERILLAPELLTNLAASFVLEARRNPRGLGSLEEKSLLEGKYQFRELDKLSVEERDVLLDAAALLFLEHNVCFRETTLDGQSYLFFPELINLKKPPLNDETKMVDGVAYMVSGAIENVYASLVVLLGYTQTFTRTNQWQNQARYVMGDGSICGFRQESDRDGELELILYFGAHVPQSGQKIFEGLFENFLARRNLTAFCYEPVICGKCKHVLERAVVRDRSRTGKSFTYCTECGKKLTLPKVDKPIQLTLPERREVDEQRRVAEQRNRFEQAVFQLASYVKTQKLIKPECFISYAWGDTECEHWVERNLAKDLLKAGIIVVLDRWENDRAGKSVSRFVSRIAECGIVIPVGTPLYFKKYKNKVSSTGSVVASEVDLINQRLMGTEADKETVMPILLAGKKKTSLPPLMWDRVHRDFTSDREYFTTAFDLILDLYQIAHNDPAVADLREALREPEMR